MKINQIIAFTINLSKWMDRNNPTQNNIKKFKIQYDKMFVFYMYRFARMKHYNDFLDNQDYGTKTLLQNWKEMKSDLFYCSDRMNFGRLVRLSRCADNIVRKIK